MFVLHYEIMDMKYMIFVIQKMEITDSTGLKSTLIGRSGHLNNIEVIYLIQLQKTDIEKIVNEMDMLVNLED